MAIVTTVRCDRCDRTIDDEKGEGQYWILISFLEHNCGDPNRKTEADYRKGVFCHVCADVLWDGENGLIVNFPYFSENGEDPGGVL